MSSRICIAYAASRIRGKEVQSANASVSHGARQTQLDSISNQGHAKRNSIPYQTRGACFHVGGLMWVSVSGSSVAAAGRKRLQVSHTVDRGLV